MTAATAEIPSGIDGVTPQWLTEALGCVVTDVRAEQIAEDSGFSSLLYRLHRVGDGVPATVIAKLPAQNEARGAMELLGGYRRELAFYRDVAGRAPMETPRYGFDEAWRHYRFAVVYLMILPVITLNGWDAMPERSRALCLKLTERAVSAIDEIDALEVFE